MFYKNQPTEIEETVWLWRPVLNCALVNIYRKCILRTLNSDHHDALCLLFVIEAFNYLKMGEEAVFLTGACQCTVQIRMFDNSCEVVWLHVDLKNAWLAVSCVHIPVFKNTTNFCFCLFCKLVPQKNVIYLEICFVYQLQVWYCSVL